MEEKEESEFGKDGDEEEKRSTSGEFLKLEVGSRRNEDLILALKKNYLNQFRKRKFFHKFWKREKEKKGIEVKYLLSEGTELAKEEKIKKNKKNKIKNEKKKKERKRTLVMSWYRGN